ncbi:MAG TPA: FHA domain-containing protein, partial [Candidatus Binataceae bacterium]|nr:FHA domain-containing protein [Candidatus Binataceae bacterium]
MTAETGVQHGPRLVGLGELSPREHPLGAIDVSVGSDLENDLVIVHPTVSRRHAALGYHAGNYTIADLQSTNGTFVNGRRIREPVPLHLGDEVAFGAAKFTLVSGTSAVAAPIKPRSSDYRMAGAIAGIVAFALIGFIATRYAISFGHRSDNQIATAPSPANLPTAVAIQEEAAPTAEPSLASIVEPDSSPLWLRRINDFRATAGLAPVDSDSRLSDGDRKHATYIMKNFATEMLTGELGAEAHTEESSRPFYTPEGAEAAR